MIYLALALWPLGEVERARQFADRAVKQAAKAEIYKRSSMSTITFASFETVRGDRQRALPVAQAVLDLAREHAMPIWKALGRFLHGWANWVLGDQQMELAEMRQGIERLHELGQGFYRPYLRGLLAEAYADEGKFDIALAELDDVLTEATTMDQHFSDAELHRIRGEILLKRDPTNTPPAEEAFLTAIAVAQQQKARSRAARGAVAGEALSIDRSCRRGPCRACTRAPKLFADPGISGDRGSADATSRTGVATLCIAVASSCCRRAPPPPISKSQTENSGGPRCRPAPATRICRAVRRPHTHRSRADHPAGNARAHTPQSSASGSDRSCRRRPHSSAPAPPDRKRWPRGRPRVREETTTTLLTRPPFRADSKERSRSADAKIQQSASTSEGGCPAASCCQQLLPKGSATADLQVRNRKQRRASLSASTGDQDLPRRSAPHTHRSRADHPAGNARAHIATVLGQRIRSGRAAADPIAPQPAPPIESAGRGAALACARKRPRHC